MGLSITLKPSPNTNFSLGFPNECVTAVICPNKSETKNHGCYCRIRASEGR